MARKSIRDINIRKGELMAKLSGNGRVHLKTLGISIKNSSRISTNQ